MRPATTTARVLSRNRATARPPISRIHILGEASSSRLIRPRVASVSASALSRASTSTRRHASTTSNLAHPHGVDKESVEGANPPMPGPSNLPASTDLLEVYRGMVAQGRLAWDEEQVRIVMKLRHLLDELAEYEPPLDLLTKLPSSPFSQSRRRARWWNDRKGKEKEWLSSLRGDRAEQGKELVRVLSGEEELEGLTTPKGILITGPPGTGKSLLLQMFFSLLPTSHKLRTHYHPFLLSLYRRVFEEMQKQRGEISSADRAAMMEVAGKRGWRAVFAGGRWEGDESLDKGQMDESMAFTIAREMILEYHILYFDELQLLDASSAALLRDVLSWYWRLGGVIISCSNRVPDDLYHHGVQRDRMSSFLSALKARCEVVTLDGGKDYRRSSEEEPQEKWFTLDQDGFEESWDSVQGKEQPRDLGVYGRRVAVTRTKGNVARFTFAELCEEPLGPADYLSITSAFSTIYIDQVPVLLLKNKNEARRLINLVDALYEARCQVFIRAASPLSTLFFPDALSSTPPSDGRLESNEAIMAAEALSETLHAPTRPNISSYNAGEAEKRESGDREDRGGVWGKLGIFTGEDERFAYKRAVSRLVEMTTSPGYQSEQWTPLDQSGRTWETKLSVSTPRTTTRPVQDRPRSKGANDDLAIEAGYSRPGRLTSPPPTSSMVNHTDERVIDHPSKGASRYKPPVIKEQHVWGVADEWGEKAGKWGAGSKAFNTKSGSGSKSKSRSGTGEGEDDGGQQR